MSWSRSVVWGVIIYSVFSYSNDVFNVIVVKVIWKRNGRCWGKDGVVGIFVFKDSLCFGIDFLIVWLLVFVVCLVGKVIYLWVEMFFIILYILFWSLLLRCVVDVKGRVVSRIRDGLGFFMLR